MKQVRNVFRGGVPHGLKESRKRQKERQEMPKFMVLVRCDGKDVARRGFVHEDAARAYAHAVESLGEIEPDGPQFEANVYAL